MTQVSRLRWVAMLVFTLASALSFLDRQILAALAPSIQREFTLTSAQYGYIVSAFSLSYALTAPLAGVFIDRVGLNMGVIVSIAAWSTVGMATGLVKGFGSLLGCRAALGITESGNLPASAKSVGIYLLPRERAIGSAVGQIGISIGMVSAPVLAGGIAEWYGWRVAFVVAGALGFLWIPLWIFVSRAIPPANPSPPPRGAETLALFRDARTWGLAAANVLSMTVYSLWTNWTTVFLVKTHGLTQQEANLRFAWIPPLFAALGGLTGGAISYRLAAGTSVINARLRTCLIAAIALLGTAAAPLVESTAIATGIICWSYFWIVAYSANTYSLPIDYFGPARAASGVAMLTAAYGLMQTVISPMVGSGVDRYGFGPVCAIIAVMPLAAYLVLKVTSKDSSEPAAA
jgi:ACS family hexuronate transporter-like MFS transporter